MMTSRLNEEAEPLQESMAQSDMISVDNNTRDISVGGDDMPDIDINDQADFEDDLMDQDVEMAIGREHKVEYHTDSFNKDGKPRRKPNYKKKNPTGIMAEGKDQRGLTGQKKFGPNLYAPKDLNFLQFYVRDKFAEILRE